MGLDTPPDNRLERPAGCSEKFYSIVEKCWEWDTEERPSAEDIQKRLEKVLANPIKYKLYGLEQRTNRYTEFGLKFSSWSSILSFIVLALTICYSQKIVDWRLDNFPKAGVMLIRPDSSGRIKRQGDPNFQNPQLNATGDLRHHIGDGFSEWVILGSDADYNEIASMLPNKIEMTKFLKKNKDLKRAYDDLYKDFITNMTVTNKTFTVSENNLLIKDKLPSLLVLKHAMNSLMIEISYKGIFMETVTG